MIRSIDELPIERKKVFIRVDFNVPLDSKGNVTDTTRIDSALPTIKYALKKKAAIILGSHLGRPKGKVVPEFSLEPVGKVLAEKLDMDIMLSDYPVGDASLKLAAELGAGQILLLENLRFHPGEKKNSITLAKELASMAEVYINDAFGTAHRAHASTFGMAEFFEYKGAGFLLKKEIEFFETLLNKPKHPFTAILGGAKVADKIGVINNLMNLVDNIFIGGAMANTFLGASGMKTGSSFLEEDKFSLCEEIISNAKAHKINFHLPVDLLIGESIDSEESRVVTIDEGVPEGFMALDIGPQTKKLYGEKILNSETVFWNGPMGVFENETFSLGTVSLAEVIAESDCLSVVGGGDSVAAIRKAGVFDKISHVSTGGGASLEMMEGKNLPGIMAILE